MEMNDVTTYMNMDRSIEAVREVVRPIIERLPPMNWEMTIKRGDAQPYSTSADVFHVIGVVNGASLALDVRVEDILKDLRQGDGTPVITRPRGPHEDMLADHEAKGSRHYLLHSYPREREAGWEKCIRSELNEYKRVYEAAVRVANVKLDKLPRFWEEDDLPDAIEEYELVNDPEALAAFRRGWIDALFTFGVAPARKRRSHEKGNQAEDPSTSSRSV
ncbi:hypothetical protein WMF04_24465 [Sorangium sp. So ce260]|uniref:hypothetical protein n=1 Tax=Sorangium sp. So ce260 TaxID=3133291 RepID=UPI003F5DB351